MNKFFLSIYDRLSKNKPLSIALLLVITALCVFSALRLDYKENITDFLPTDPEKERYTSVYNDLGNQGQITVIFAADTTKLVDDEAIDAVIEAMDAFESHWKACDTAKMVSDLQCRVDGSQVFDAIDFIRENQALFLTESDYQRMDSLLADPDCRSYKISSRDGDFTRLRENPLAQLPSELSYMVPSALRRTSANRLE